MDRTCSKGIKKKKKKKKKTKTAPCPSTERDHLEHPPLSFSYINNYAAETCPGIYTGAEYAGRSNRLLVAARPGTRNCRALSFDPLAEYHTNTPRVYPWNEREERIPTENRARAFYEDVLVRVYGGVIGVGSTRSTDRLETTVVKTFSSQYNEMIILSLTIGRNSIENR